MNLEHLEERPLSTALVEEVTYGDSIHVVIPWSCLSSRNGRALRTVLEDRQLEAGIELGFSIADLEGITLQDILDVRNIGKGTIRSLISEIQDAINEIHKNPNVYNPTQTLWDIPVGARLPRKEIHDRFGGVREGGISPVDTKSRNIMIFSHPRANAEHGYEPDIWLDDDTFLYCGEGPSGDQAMVRYNKSILQHAEKDKVLRVFDGTRGEVTYRGAFELDRENPWFTKESIGFDGNPRKVIMFRMSRIDSTATSSLIDEPSENAFRWNCRVHESTGSAITLEEIEFLATAHMSYKDNSSDDCEIQISTPESDFEDINEEQLTIRNRNREMADLRSAGKSLEEIGAQYGVTRERVRQILEKIGGPSRQDVKALRESIKSDKLEEVKSRALELVKFKPGLTISAVADQLEVSSIELSRILTNQELNLFAKPLRTGNFKWTDEEVVKVIQEAATLEFPLTVAAYAKLLEDGYLRGPSAARISQRFRSWQAACDLAGVEAGKRTRPLDLSRWTNEDLYAAVIHYLRLPQSTGAAADYDSWASGQDDVPSMGTLRNRLGPWNQIRNDAIERMQNGE